MGAQSIGAVACDDDRWLRLVLGSGRSSAGSSSDLSFAARAHDEFVAFVVAAAVVFVAIAFLGTVKAAAAALLIF